MKERLKLTPTNKENLYFGIKKDGRKYSVRADRKRYFFPDEWERFYNALNKDKTKLFFLACLHTGARAMEILNLKSQDFDYDRKSITFHVIKKRSAKRNSYAIGKTRTFFISEKLLRQIKSYVKKYKLVQNQYLFLNNNKLPENYNNLTNKEKREYFKSPFVSYSNILKRTLKKVGVEDYYNFSLHNQIGRAHV